MDSIQHVLDADYLKWISDPPTIFTGESTRHTDPMNDCLSTGHFARFIDTCVCTEKISFFQRIVRDARSKRVVRSFNRKPYPSLFRRRSKCTCAPCKNSKREGVRFWVQGTTKSRWVQDFGPRRKEAFLKGELEAFEQQRKLQGTNRVDFETPNTLGFGPNMIRSGDTIWRIQEAAVPFLLRPSWDHYTVIGECYLHGVESRQHQFFQKRITLR